MEIVEGGFYILSDQYFEDFQTHISNRIKQNAGRFIIVSKI